ncbi:MAG: transglycosylase SLT domain-containing protein [Candidatus Moraniibacteriota bacterium]
MNFKLKQISIFSVISFLLIFLPKIAAAASKPFDYSPMEEIPGFGRPASYEAYILAVYKFGLWTVGISAILMISIGAFMYITSAGNTSSMGKAKEIIFDAIAGVILALTSYVLLYTINPNLLDIKGVNQMIDDAARSYDGTYPTIDSPLPTKCTDAQWQDIFASVASSSGLDKCLLEAVTAKESSCNQQPSRTNGGQDCGAMQTRASGCPNTTSCSELETEPEKAIACGAEYLKKNSDGLRRTDASGEQAIHDYYAGFNGGPGALDWSTSCDATMQNSYGNRYQKWDCPRDCGGYCVVPARTATVLNYYKQCKARP